MIVRLFAAIESTLAFPEFVNVASYSPTVIAVWQTLPLLDDAVKIRFCASPTAVFGVNVTVLVSWSENTIFLCPLFMVLPVQVPSTAAPSAVLTCTRTVPA